jgi:hypothetical protein
MNPFGIIQAVITAAEGVIHLTNPKRRKETSKESRWFLVIYWNILLLGTGIVGWVVYSLYFSK